MNNPFETIDLRLSNIEMLLLDLKHKAGINNSDLVTDTFLTVPEAANFLKLEPPTIYSLVSRKEIPHSKRGKRLYFSKQILTEWLKEGRKKTKAEIATDAASFILSKKRKG